MNWSYIKEFAIVVLVILCGIQTWRLNAAQNELKEQVAKHAVYVAQSQAAMATQMSVMTNMVLWEAKNASEAWKEVEMAKAESVARAASLGAVNDRLRAELSRIRADVNTGVTTQCGDAIEAAILYTDLFDRCKSEYRELGEWAETATFAGESCNRSYNAVKSVTVQ